MQKTEALTPIGTGVVTVYLATMQTSLAIVGLGFTIVLTYFMIKRYQKGIELDEKDMELKDAELEDLKRRQSKDLRCKGCEK